MKLLDVLLFLICALAFAAFLGLFGTSGWLYFLVYTPAFLLYIPPLVWLGYTYLVRRQFLWHWALLLVFQTFLLLFVLGHTPLFTQASSPATNQKTTMALCDWNSSFFFSQDRDGAMKFLQAKHCDIIVLQEVWNAETQMTEINRIHDLYFSDYDLNFGSEFLMFTPKHSTMHEDIGANQGLLAVTLRDNQRNITIADVHLWNPLVERPEMSGQTITYIAPQELRSLQESELLAYIHKTLPTVDDFIVIGDFNSEANDPILREIAAVKPAGSSNLLSSVNVPFWQASNTYPSNFPLLQIDHAFLSRSLLAGSHEQLECHPNFSDHCLLILTFLL